MALIKFAIILITSAGFSLLMVPNSYSAYADAMKAQFNMTQTQASILESGVLVSFMFMLPASFIYDHYGIMPTALVSLLVTTVGWASVWLTVLLRNYMKEYGVYAIWITMAIAGHGRSYISLLGKASIPQMVSPGYRSIVLASQEITGSLGIFFVSFVYETWFINGHTLDPEKQSLSSFMFGVLIVSVLVSALMAVATPFSERYRYVEGNNGQAAINYNIIEDEEAVTNNRHEVSETTSVGMIQKINDIFKAYIHEIFTLSFQLVLWSTSIPMAINYVFPFNVTYMTRSLSLVHLDYYLVMAQRIIFLTGTLSVTAVVSLAKNFTYVNETLLILCNTLMFISQLLQFIPEHRAIIFSLSYALVILNGACIKLLVQFILSCDNEIDRFPFKYSVAKSTTCLAMLLIEISFGRLYDSQIPQGGGIYCYGSSCLTKIYMLTSTCCMFSLILSVMLIYVKHKNNS